MRYLFVLVALVGVFVGASSVSAKATTDSTAFQGSLNDASDKPVPDGPHDLILSVWTDSVGGTMLHSETVVVTVSKGLFSTCIGCGGSSFLDVISDQSLYLQIQVPGESPMTPRTVLRNVPRALVSSRVRGDIVTSPGLVVVGDSTTGGYARVNAGLHAAGSAISQGVSRITNDCDDTHASIAIDESGVHRCMIGTVPDASGSSSEMSLKVYDPTKTYVAGDAVIYSNAAKTGHQVSRDLNGDGAPDVVTSLEAEETRTTLKSHFQNGSIPTQNDMVHTVDATGASIDETSDADGDGVADRSAKLSLTDDRSLLGLRSLHGLPPGTPADDNVALETNGDSASLVLRSLNGLPPGTPWENNIRLATNGTTSSIGINEKLPYATLHVSRSGSPAAASILAADVDLDGFEDRSASTTCDATNSRLVLVSGSNGNGSMKSAMQSSPDSAVSVHEYSIAGETQAATKQYVDANDAMVQVGTKGTGTYRNSANIAAVLNGNVVIGSLVDVNGDGVPESQTEQLCAPDSVVQSAEVGDASSGSIYNMRTRINQLEQVLQNHGLLSATRISSRCDQDSAAETGTVTGSTSTATYGQVATGSLIDSYVHMMDDGVMRKVSMKADASSTSLTVDSHQIQCRSAVDNNAGVYSGQMEISDSGVAMISFSSSGDGFVSKRFGIGVQNPTNPLEHSSGAHLTAGGVWTNASDKSLKENFKPVDGGALLGKIDELPISQWNYKNESDEVTHIGPTAQDFKKVFGVGENDKTISTIDPSGIALAAIKELNSQNRELKEVNARLKKQLDDLARKVDRLAANK